MRRRRELFIELTGGVGEVMLDLVGLEVKSQGNKLSRVTYQLDYRFDNAVAFYINTFKC